MDETDKFTDSSVAHWHFMPPTALMESLRENFTGVDAHGHKWVDGKQVAKDQEPTSARAPATAPPPAKEAGGKPVAPTAAAPARTPEEQQKRTRLAELGKRLQAGAELSPVEMKEVAGLLKTLTPEEQAKFAKAVDIALDDLLSYAESAEPEPKKEPAKKESAKARDQQKTDTGPKASKTDLPTTPADKAFVEKVLGDIAPEQLGAMANLTEGGEVKVSRNAAFPNAVIVQTKGNGVTATRHFSRGADGQLSVENYELVIDDKSPYKGKGAELFATQVATLKKAGVSKITTLAAGNAAEAAEGGYNGYYTWPRLGYDGLVPDKYLQKMPAELKSQAAKGGNILSAVFATPEGRDWWKTNGGSVRLAFSLAADSKQVKALETYTQERKAKGAGRGK